MDITRTTKAVIRSTTGERVAASHVDGSGVINLTVGISGGRASITATEARELAAWLVTAAKNADATTDRSPGRESFRARTW